MTELLFYVIYFEIIKQLTNEEVRRFIKIIFLFISFKNKKSLFGIKLNKDLYRFLF